MNHEVHSERQNRCEKFEPQPKQRSVKGSQQRKSWRAQMESQPNDRDTKGSDARQSRPRRWWRHLAESQPVGSWPESENERQCVRPRPCLTAQPNDRDTEGSNACQSRSRRWRRHLAESQPVGSWPESVDEHQGQRPWNRFSAQLIGSNTEGLVNRRNRTLCRYQCLSRE